MRHLAAHAYQRRHACDSEGARAQSIREHDDGCSGERRISAVEHVPAIAIPHDATSLTPEIDAHPLVGPRKARNASLLHDYEMLFGSGDIRICPISTKVIRLAAELRADTGLKTPDAIHAATALIDGCAHFLTNDGGFSRASALQIVLLKDCLP